MAEQRLLPQRPTRKKGEITFGDGMTWPCFVTSITTQGVILSIPRGHELPTDFFLSVDAIIARVSIVWRVGIHVGAKFIGLSSACSPATAA